MSKRMLMRDIIKELDDASDEQLSIIEAVLAGDYQKIGTALGILSYQVNIYKDTPCPTCGGSGVFDSRHKEWRWGGAKRHPFKQGDACPTCNGRGSFAEPNGLVELCSTCYGTGRKP